MTNLAGWGRTVAVLALLFVSITSPVDAQQLNGGGAAGSVMRAGDQLRIRVWPDSSLGGVFTVEADGSVHLPVIGALPAAGLSLAAVRSELRSRYGIALKSPTVSVTHLFNVSVLGAVQRPGLYQVTATHGLMDLISLAGGFSDNAKEGEVRVLRGEEVVEFDAEQVLRGGGYSFAGLRSGDTVVVPRSWSISFRDVVSVVQLIAITATLVAQFSKE